MRIRVPGDKSLTQRALILASLAEGESRLTGLLTGGDARSTAGALRDMGVSIPEFTDGDAEVRVHGVGLTGLAEPEDPLDLGNSGTGARLLLGVIAGTGITATMDGDASLRTRPMARVVDPLTAMGARFSYDESPGLLPLTVTGRHPLQPLDWSSPVASAQVKSAILLAGLTGRAFALVTEPRRSRDHTEHLFNQVGAKVVSHAVEGGWRVELRDPPTRIDPLDFHVPGDFSSAAFLLALAALGGAGQGLTVEGVGLNPTRTAFLEVLGRMGANVAVDDQTPVGSSEPVGDVTVSPAQPLKGTEILEQDVPRLIDELPLVAVLGACAEGTTRITGAAELRTKESDRIAAVCTNLRTLGVEVEELPDGMVIEGSDRPLSGRVGSWQDHRIAMSFAVLGALPQHAVEVDHPMVAAVSFPRFRETLHYVTVRS